MGETVNMKLNIAQLREKAEKATKGKWERDPQPSVRLQVIASGNEVVAYHHIHPRQVDAHVVPNFEFIAAFNPETVLELLRQRDVLMEACKGVAKGHTIVKFGGFSSLDGAVVHEEEVLVTKETETARQAIKDCEDV